MNKNDVFGLMKDHYLKNGHVMDPHKFENIFIGHVETSEAIEGLMMFDKFLDSYRYTIVTDNKEVKEDEFGKITTNAESA